MALTNNSRIAAASNPQAGVYFIPDNTGRNLTYTYATVSTTTGTVTITPQSFHDTIHLPNALTGGITFSVAATYSYNGGPTGSTVYTGCRPQINDRLTILVTGGAAAYTVCYGSNIMGAGSTFSTNANAPVIIEAKFNGTEYVATQTIAKS